MNGYPGSSLICGNLAEDPFFATLRRTWEGDLRCVYVPLGNRALRVPGPHLHVRLGVHGRLVGEGRVAEPVEGAEGLGDLRPRECRLYVGPAELRRIKR